MSLLFYESPLLATTSLSAIGLSAYLQAPMYVTGFFIVIFLFLLYFYRYKKYEGAGARDSEILSPCEGTVLKVYDKNPNYLYIAIFLSPMNRHTQIYPVNGTVIKRQYDHTGKFEIVMDLNKSRHNEKKMHYISMKNGTLIKITQIAGFLPRMITSSEETPMNVVAGDYLGMMKFGSRVDMLIPWVDTNGKFLQLKTKEEEELSIGDLLACYK